MLLDKGILIEEDDAMERIIFKARDGKELSLVVWKTDEPKGIIQIAHGMCEHISRYDGFANYLNENGYMVIGHDLRAHGKTDPDRLGLAEKGKDLFKDSVDDLIEIAKKYKDEYNLKILLLGHSYGSFLAQEILLYASDIYSCCVLCGSALYPSITPGFAKFVASLKNPDKPGNFFAKLTFRSYDKKVNEGLNGWISKNAENNKRYNEDPECGFLCSNGFYKYFFTHLKKLSKCSFDSIRKDIPIILAYGTEDDVGERGKLVKKLEAKYIKFGITPVMKSYEGGRHEILNELNAEEVFKDMLDCFNRAL